MRICLVLWTLTLAACDTDSDTVDPAQAPDDARRHVPWAALGGPVSAGGAPVKPWYIPDPVWYAGGEVFEETDPPIETDPPDDTDAPVDTGLAAG